MRKIGLLIMMCILGITYNLQAQLMLKSNGSVKIGSQSSWPSGGKLEITGMDETLELRIFSGTMNISRMWTLNSKYAFGFGIDENGYGHVYRNIHIPSSIMTFNSSGQFGIGRRPSYQLDVNGNIRANSIIVYSNEDLKEKVDLMSIETKKLFKLRRISYKLSESMLSDYIQTETMDLNNILKQPRIEDNEIHYGFLVHDVKEFYPELVYEDENGVCGIDYISLFL